jgi:lipopolysaccharide transport system ATP-binding protein
MSEPVIRVENLSKKYIIGQQKQEKYSTLRDMITNGAKSVVQTITNTQARTNNNQEEFWALKDVSFEIKQGDRVGIIGRNGAGKSTLLKILSRITEPTKGRINIQGRVASLLEVGTGFHPELTGRENIFLNGAILGMSKVEIKKKFDEIVAFAEIEKFLDTPVKRYSSGMYVRLAFAVAAHLEPEILIVDEVLAVGDSQFQKKCLGKMEDVGKEGRTVLFVSHNMQAIQLLCKTALHLKSGQVVNWGESKSVVTNYLADFGTIKSQMTWAEENAPGNEEAKLTAIKVYSDSNNSEIGTYSSRDNLFVNLEIIINQINSALCVGFDLINSEGTVLLRSYQTDLDSDRWIPLTIGKNTFVCKIPASFFNSGIYYICPRIGIHNLYWIVNLDAVIQFEIVLDHGISPLWNSLNGKNRPGVIAPILAWK